MKYMLYYFLDMMSFSTSKENYLLMYYIIHSIIMSNHRRLLHVNNYIFKSSLLVDVPGNKLFIYILSNQKIILFYLFSNILIL